MARPEYSLKFDVPLLHHVILSKMQFSKVKVLTNVFCALLGGAVSYFPFSSHSPFASKGKMNANADVPTTPNNNCGYSLVRGLTGGFVNPLLLVDPDCESSTFTGLKATIQNYIDENKVSGRITSASVYFRDLITAEWMDCNPDLTYHPGSLAKVPMLFAYLKKAETDPSILKKTLFFDKVAEGHVHNQTFNGKAIVKGNSYTVRELLDYMIGSSDNAATYLLNTNMGFDPYLKIFSDLGLRVPSTTDRNYEMSTKEYSRFLIVLYNSTYLSTEMSQMACSILNNNEFNDGILKALPSTLKVIHKFGEMGDNTKNSHELHESAIVFYENRPYLLTVMTKGNDKKLLPEMLTRISSIAFDYVRGGGKNPA